ncbi:uncharacterized protein LAESUDRAFT_653615, partial [Laetiporus sulphureus 93-53]
VGAQVMLIKNMVQGELVNGSVGRVIQFSTPREALEAGTQLAQPKSGHESAAERNTEKVPDEIMNGKNVWPVVRFTNGMTLLCIPNAFDVNDASGRVQAVRNQVRYLSLPELYKCSFVYEYPGSSDPCMGVEYTQITRPDPGKSARKPVAYL